MTKTFCPRCKEVVSELAPEHGGTVTDNSLRRWHLDCWNKECEELEKTRKENKK